MGQVDLFDIAHSYFADHKQKCGPPQKVLLSKLKSFYLFNDDNGMGIPFWVTLYMNG